MILTKDVSAIATMIGEGDVVAYPTEGVYGLGCDPFNEDAVKRLLKIKQRPVEQGLILISDRWETMAPLTQPVDDGLMESVHATWPGPFTWLFPKGDRAPQWITGTHDAIACRLSDHPLVRKLCTTLEVPLVSTSANVSGEPACMTAQEVSERLDAIDAILDGPLGGLQVPSTIKDVLTGQVIRG